MSLGVCDVFWFLILGFFWVGVCDFWCFGYLFVFWVVNFGFKFLLVLDVVGVIVFLSGLI